MGPREPHPRSLPRLDRAPWTWRLSGQAGGTGDGWAVERKVRVVRGTQWHKPGPRSRADCTLSNRVYAGGGVCAGPGAQHDPRCLVPYRAGARWERD